MTQTRPQTKPSKPSYYALIYARAEQLTNIRNIVGRYPVSTTNREICKAIKKSTKRGTWWRTRRAVRHDAMRMAIQCHRENVALYRAVARTLGVLSLKPRSGHELRTAVTKLL